jgi:hypothetical protein
MAASPETPWVSFCTEVTTARCVADVGLPLLVTLAAVALTYTWYVGDLLKIGTCKRRRDGSWLRLAPVRIAGVAEAVRMARVPTRHGS